MTARTSALSRWARRVISHPGVYRHVVLRLAALTTVAEAVLRRIGGGRLSVLDAVGLTHVQLIVAGCRSGLPRTVTLQYIGDGDDLLVTDSNWGRNARPAWSSNLAAASTVLVRLRDSEYTAAVVHATGAARDRDWHTICAHWPNYAVAQSVAGREFRVFRLVPAAA
ncbi:nitroreductase family deazaflavin-dependent oxidoreductase [Mycolicibacterium sp. P9-22]|uniref:nitroreductase family deazaflavin-dependent oxidoreductase n=1 Tax=Mycolicibacterium sp. P9-22 TaxID=2024613 RepID=UPI0011ECB39D|nr:nitroreductase family deazaflavin-dependent oxidoreductase [Mycolicibacterium sp. P9-22]KAA0114603.1 nitroreductase family deazaflavin-dependent oxidoreductase [Mycolicibacterium sp. P9-22]